MSALIALLAALARAVPALEALVRSIAAECDRRRHADSLAQLAAKDAAVDAAIAAAVRPPPPDL